MRTTFLIFLLCSFTFTTLLAQNDKPEKGSKHPSFIKVKDKPRKDKAKQLFKEMFGMKAKDALNLASIFSDEQGFSHETYQQYYDGIKVEGATYRVHVKGNKIWYMSGNYRDIFEDLSVRPSVSSSMAFNQALAHVGASRYIWDNGGSPPTGELVVVADPSGNATPKLAYKFDIYATEPLYRAYVYIDAHSSQFISENHRIHHADATITGTSLYNGNVTITADHTGGTNHRLRQTTDGINTFDLNNGTNYGTATDITDNALPFNSDPTGVQAHWGAEQTHKYYLQDHGRNSFDNVGGIINSYVHYSNNYVNAFWDGQRMTYGDGDGTNYGPLVSLDIVGHEITHGVTEYSANLVYSYESGALNESFSDIFGEAIENFATGTNNWRMGTDIGANGSDGAIRSMSNPNEFGDPDTYLGANWYTGSGDNGGVHYNSGVQNKWFYILSVGENGTNDNGNSYSVTGIGIDKAAAIAYRNLTVYLSSSSGYFDARTGAVQAAQDLFGAGSAEEIATADAWYAVGVGGPYGSLSYCTSQGNSSFYEWIANVTIGAFSNSSGASSYTDFTSQVVNVDEGQSYPISLTPGFRSTVYNEYWKIWIDYNSDGDFGDPGELAYSSGGLSNTTVTGTINIPAGTGGTTTRMRISMKWNGSQTECESFSYGEVEDYTIDIAGGTPTPLSASISSSTDVSCNGLNDGSATASASGGVTPYTYVWSNGGSSATVTGLAPGSYTATVTDSDSPASTATASVTISEPAFLSAAPSDTDVSCGGTDNGSASANASGGTAPLSYNWTGPGGFTASSASINGLASGNYNVVVTDANGCQASGGVTITDPNSTWYADTDGDTYGDAGTSIRACTQPGGYVANDTDCDDGNGAVNPGATEVCDGIDNNCDGNIDEGYSLSTYYADADSDTFGDPASPITACVQPPGFVTNSGDCDDTDGSVHPGVTEICDGIDNNCDGTVDEGCSGCSTPINANDFESGLGIWNDGGSDCSLGAYSAPYANGTYSVRLRDNTNSSTMTTDNLNLTAYSAITVAFSYYPVSMDNPNEDFWLQISTNGGSTYTTIKEWHQGIDFNNDQRYDNESVTINGPFTSSTRLRFRCDASGNNDWVYIDDVVLKGCAISGALIVDMPGLENGKDGQRETANPEITRNEFVPELMDMRLFPNPVSSELSIACNLPETTAAQLIITDINGQMLRRELLEEVSGEQLVNLDVSTLTDGFYMVHLITKTGRMSKKFVVVK